MNICEKLVGITIFIKLPKIERGLKMKKLTEIRWHGRGGQGAKTASLLLADVAFSTGLYIQGFPEYGPERMGAICYVVWVVDVGVNAEWFVAQSVVSCDWSTHSFRTVFWETLNVETCAECYVCKEEGSCFSTLATATVPTDFCEFFHF